jgi:hypothetical protein
MMGYMWNETAHQPALRQHLMQILAKSSATRPTMVVVLEPAIYEVARDAMMLRDVLVQKGLKPLYPCSHGLTCPMQARPKDFCYSEFAADLGHIQNHIDKAAGITRKMLAASCYIFANVDVLPLQDQRPMVVGRPLQKDAAHPKTYDYLLCSEGGITKRPGDLLPRPRGTAHR